jgi:hypothetical protein
MQSERAHLGRSLRVFTGAEKSKGFQLPVPDAKCKPESDIKINEKSIAVFPKSTNN